MADSTTTTVVDDFEIRLTRSSPVPLYHQISDQLMSAIDSGAIAKGTFFPNEIELAEDWGVSRPTVRRAIQDLVDRGLVVRRRGVGTQVVTAGFRRNVGLTSLYDDLLNSGRTPTTRVLTCEVVPADTEAANQLGIEPGAPALLLRRLRLAEGRPLAIMTNWVNVEIAEGLTATALESHGFYDELRRRGVQPLIALQTIGAKTASAVEAEMLDLEEGAPLVTMRRTMQDTRGRVVEFGSHAYDASQYAIETTVMDSP